MIESVEHLLRLLVVDDQIVNIQASGALPLTHLTFLCHVASLAANYLDIQK